MWIEYSCTGECRNSDKKKPARFAGRIHIKGGDMEETVAVYERMMI